MVRIFFTQTTPWMWGGVREDGGASNANPNREMPWALYKRSHLLFKEAPFCFFAEPKPSSHVPHGFSQEPLIEGRRYPS